MEKKNTTVQVLVEGYARPTDNGWKASSTCCYIHSSGLNIITDPGCNRKALLEALNRERLETNDIDMVFLSHGHPDHILLAGIFENARYLTYDANLLYSGDTMAVFEKDVLGSDIEILSTPGHVPEHLSLLVKTHEGTVAIAGDVFWWMDHEIQDTAISRTDPSEAAGMDMDKLFASRRLILKHADLIIPGHGKQFRTK